MSEKTGLVEFVLDKAADFDGKKVAVEGLLVVAGDSGYVEISTAAGPLRISIGDAAFVGRLIDEVPCYLGGDYLYRDAVRIVGIVAARDINDLRISKVESGVLRRGDENFPF